MMRLFSLALILFGAMLLVAPRASLAADCDFTAIKDSLYGTESKSAGGYTAVNSTINPRTGKPFNAAGRYQFIPSTRSSYIRSHPECKTESGKPPGVCDSVSGWISKDCWPVQECIMNAFMADNLNRIRKDPACQALLAPGGRSVTGTKYKAATLTCKATESGLLAAFHLGGTDECRDMLANGHGDSDGKTSTAWYTCKHGGLAVPGSCTPTPTNTSESPTAAIEGPTATMEQLDFSGLDLSGPLDPLREWWDAALMLMAEQFSVNMEAQVEAIGMMFDAKHQLETQRLYQEKMAEAHKDYQPSEQMCTFGTFARDLMSTERTANVSKAMVAEHILEKEIGQGETLGMDATALGLSRIGLFRKKFCDPNDNAGGLKDLCPDGTAPAPELRNRDINYTDTLDQPLSLDIDLNDPAVSEDEETVFALVDNLFATEPLPRSPDEAQELRKFNYNYLNLRSITAMRGIARNSVANIIALKTATPNRDEKTNAPYLRALMREFGLQDEEILKFLGENPSYYAQMEFLTRKMYQSPQFYTNLYDKPANVQRIRAAMKAIKLMQDRDIQAALQRREMLMSVLLELKLRKESDGVYNALENTMFNNSLSGTAPPSGGGG